MACQSHSHIEESSRGIAIVRERALADDDIVEQWTECSSLSGDFNVLHGHAHNFVGIVAPVIECDGSNDHRIENDLPLS